MSHIFNLNRAYKLEQVKAHLDQYAQRYVMGACSMTLVFLVGMFVGEWKESGLNDERFEAVHTAGMNVGYQLAINSNTPTIKGCMAWWFEGDTKKVGQAIKKIKFEGSKL